MDDAGQYQCLAENEMGAVEKVVVLVLQSELRPPLSRALDGDSVRWVLRAAVGGCGWCGPGHLIRTEGGEAGPGPGIL